MYSINAVQVHDLRSFIIERGVNYSVITDDQGNQFLLIDKVTNSGTPSQLPAGWNYVEEYAFEVTQEISIAPGGTLFFFHDEFGQLYIKVNP